MRAKVLLTWTPTVSGSLTLLPNSDNGDADYANFDAYIWKGSVANTDFPDFTAASSTFNTDHPQPLSVDVEPPLTGNPPGFFVKAGQPYTVILVNWGGHSGAVMDLDGLLNSLAGFGGLAAPFFPPPPFPAGFPNTLVQLPSGVEVLRASGAVDAGEGYSTHAEGHFTHAEGYSTHAEGYSTHAEGNSTHAEGYSTHAEGNSTHAEGNSTHAEGNSTHAEGNSTHAYRTGEHAESSGTFSDNSPTQVSRLTLAAETTDATPTVLVVGYNFLPTTDLPLTDNTLSTVTGHVGARSSDGTLCAGWAFAFMVDRASGVSRLVGAATITPIAVDAGASAWAVGITASTDGAAITVTGEAATTIRWVTMTEIVEVRYGTT